MISIRETGRSTLKMKYHIAKYNEISANCQKILRPYMEYFKQKMLSVEAYCILTL